MEASVRYAESSVLDHVAHLEYKYVEDVFVEGEEIRPEGERRVDRDSLFF